MQQAIARKAILDLHPPWKAEEIDDRASALLLALASEFNIEGIVPGHIKALVREGDNYAAFSCTRPGQVNKKASPYWDRTMFQHPFFNLNVVLVNEMTVEAAADKVDDCLRKIFGPVHFSSGCDHEYAHDHEHDHADS